VVWSYDTRADGSRAEFHGDPLVTDELVIVGADVEPLAFVYAFDRTTGVARSRAQAAGGLYGALTQAGDCVLALSLANTLTCFADDLTAARWSAAATKEWSASRPLALGDLVLAGNDQGELVAFRVDDGGEVFRLRAGGVVRGLGHADGIVYVGTLRGEVMAVELPPASQP
jgi:outer membrane protein assembly factor BamB